MPSAPPQDNTRQHEAEIAAALLLIGRRYSLPALIEAAKVKPRPFRKIEPTEALRADLAAPYFAIIRAWRAERDTLIAAYTAALPPQGQPLAPGAAQALQRQVDASAARVAVQLTAIDRQFSGVLNRLERWHRLQWTNRIRSATTLDVSLFTSPHDVAAEIQNGTAVNEQLARAIHSELQHKVGTTLLNSLLAFVPAAAVVTSLSGTFDAGKARAARVGVDQTDTTSVNMTRARMRSAGLARWKWRHTPQPHPRPEHVLRDGRVYTVANQPNDLPGVLPFCKCYQEPLFD